MKPLQTWIFLSLCSSYKHSKTGRTFILVQMLSCGLMCCSSKYPYPSHGKVFSLNPPPPTLLENPFLCHNFLKKIRLLKPPSPLEFPLTFLGVGLDIFWNYTFWYMFHRNDGKWFPCDCNEWESCLWLQRSPNLFWAT